MGKVFTSGQNNVNFKHGMSNSPEFKCWSSVRERCLNSRHKSYKHYGGRGIKICERWLDFRNFYKDMGPRLLGTSLDRTDVNGDYEPINCRWATSIEQGNNRRDSYHVRFTDKDLLNIIELYKHNKLTTEKLGKKFNLNHMFIGGLIRGYELKSGFPVSLGFENISLVPQKNVCSSRLDANTQSEVFREFYLDSPILSANMSSVSNSKFCILMSKLGAMGILHRAAEEDILIEETKTIAKECGDVAVSIGLGQNDLFQDLVNAGANIIFIDIANGYSDEAIEFCRFIKRFKKDLKVILGNTTHVGLMYEADKYCDGIKIGISQGFACETANTAGFTEKQFSAVLKFKEASKRLGLPVISDGGIREPADFVKALAGGANSVMAGMIFARCPESAAETILVDGIPKKIYAGMASRYVQNTWKGGIKAGTCPEGKVTYLSIGEPVSSLVERYTGALRSGITYGGARNIAELQRKAEFVEVTRSYHDEMAVRK